MPVILSLLISTTSAIQTWAGMQKWTRRKTFVLAWKMRVIEHLWCNFRVFFLFLFFVRSLNSLSVLCPSLLFELRRLLFLFVWVSFYCICLLISSFVVTVHLLFQHGRPVPQSVFHLSSFIFDMSWTCWNVFNKAIPAVQRDSLILLGVLWWGLRSWLSHMYPTDLTL